MNKDNLKIILSILSCFIAIIGILWYEKKNEPLSDKWIKIEMQHQKNTTVKDTSIKHLVHIAGAVNNPGLYHVTPNIRVSKALSLAKGPKENANLDKVNLAGRITDGKRIFVPYLKQKKIKKKKIKNTIKKQTININTASKTELLQLSNIGNKRALAIIKHRSIQKFQNINDLKKIKGIGPKTISDWQKKYVIKL